MWISRTEFFELLHAKSQAEGVAQALEKQVAVHQTSLDWMKVRVNQLESERAQLLFAATGAKLNVPEIIRRPVDDTNPLLELPAIFEDVGDEVADRLHIFHAADGTLTDRKPAPRFEETKES
jgi:hypothetical protein